MPISIFPEAVAATSSASSPSKKYFTATSAYTLYKVTGTYGAGTYTMTSSAGVIANFQFYSGETLVVSATTSSGTATATVSSACDEVRFYIQSSSNELLSLDQTGGILSVLSKGQNYTVTNTSTFTETGTGYALIVGAGGNGGGPSGTGNQWRGGGGGGSGGVQFVGPITFNGSMPIVIGANGSPGGATSFGGYTSNGGGSGGSGSSGGGGGGGNAGTPGGVAGGAGAFRTLDGGYASNGSSTSVTVPAPWYIQRADAVTGSGGGGAFDTRGTGGGGSLGSGGAGGQVSAGSNGAGGYGGGGGGGGGSPNAGYGGTSGSSGVVIIYKI